MLIWLNFSIIKISGKFKVELYLFLQQDCLVKQGLTIQQSDDLLINVNKLANTVNFDIRLAMNFIQDQVYIVLLILLHMHYQICFSKEFIKDHFFQLWR